MFDLKTIVNVTIGAVIGLALFTVLLETPVRKLAEKVPYNK
jgi:hypothetical protein